MNAAIATQGTAATRTIAAQLAGFASDARRHGLSRSLRHGAVRRLLDYAGISLLARRQPVIDAVRTVAEGWETTGSSGSFGSAHRYAAATAAFINGTLAHALDFDDSHFRSVLHPSASVWPAALAVAQVVGVDGTALLDAATIGTEFCIRLGLGGYDAALGNSIFFERGQHATSICGTVGAACAAAMLYGLDAAGIESALGIAASFGAGLLEANRTGGTIKRVHCGWAAHAGVVAAELARAGITGAPTIFEGRFGFFQAWCGELAHPEAVLDGLGEDWEVTRIVQKPYPCNHFTHPGIDAALKLRAAGLRVEDIAQIELGAATAVLRTIAEPAQVKAHPPSGYAAAFSGPYTVAAALIGGGGLGVWLDDFSDALALDPRYRALASKVSCVADARCDELFPLKLAGVLRVRKHDGSVQEARIDASRGSPDWPLSDEELVQKFALCAAAELSTPGTQRLREAIEGLADGGAVEALFFTETDS